MGPKRFLSLQPRLVLAGVLVLIGFGAYALPAAAQDEAPGDVTTVTTFVRLCLEPGCTELLELTEAVDGVPVTMADATTGDPLGTCTTGDSESGACALDVPASVTSVTITLDDTAFPEGYTASDNPATLDLANAAEYPFLLMPVDGFPEDPVEQDPPVVDEESSPVAEAAAADDGQDGGDVSSLPSTGMQVASPESDDAAVSDLPVTGSGSSGDSASVWLTAVTALVSVLGLAAMGARRMLQRR